MAKTRGGKKRQHQTKQKYQDHCRAMVNAGLAPGASGQWIPQDTLSEKIKNVYIMQRR